MKIISETVIFRQLHFALVRQDVAMSNGAIVESISVHRPQIVAILPILSGGEVLLIRQYRPALDKTIWEVPAGKMLAETPFECAARELEEEVGYHAGKLEQLGTIAMEPGWTDERLHIFAATDLTRTTQRLDIDEEIEVVPTSLDRAMALVNSGELFDAKSVLALCYGCRLFHGFAAFGARSL